jgi:hypothetical protein
MKKYLVLSIALCSAMIISCGGGSGSNSGAKASQITSNSMAAIEQALTVAGISAPSLSRSGSVQSESDPLKAAAPSPIWSGYTSPSGDLKITGTYTTTGTGATASVSCDVNITFTNYVYDGVTINGTVEYKWSGSSTTFSIEYLEDIGIAFDGETHSIKSSLKCTMSGSIVSYTGYVIIDGENYDVSELELD